MKNNDNKYIMIFLSFYDNYYLYARQFRNRSEMKTGVDAETGEL